MSNIELLNKELLSEVLGFKTYIIGIEDNNIFYELPNEMPKSINIYELAYKCKEWAYNKGFVYAVVEEHLHIISSLYSVSFLTDYKPYEPSVDFEACRYILNNKKIKGTK